MHMTRDKALKKARLDANWQVGTPPASVFDTFDHSGYWSTFLASLRESGWTLARVEPTEAQIKAAAKAIDPSAFCFPHPTWKPTPSLIRQWKNTAILQAKAAILAYLRAELKE